MDHQPLIELDAMALAVVEADGLQPLETIERPRRTGGRVLAARLRAMACNFLPRHNV
jgi:hypothetical protein